MWMVFDGRWSNALQLQRYPEWLKPSKQLDFAIAPDMTADGREDVVILVKKSSGRQAYMVYEGLRGGA